MENPNKYKPSLLLFLNQFDSDEIEDFRDRYYDCTEKIDDLHITISYNVKNSSIEYIRKILSKYDGDEIIISLRETSILNDKLVILVDSPNIHKLYDILPGDIRSTPHITLGKASNYRKVTLKKWPKSYSFNKITFWNGSIHTTFELNPIKDFTLLDKEPNDELPFVKNTFKEEKIHTNIVIEHEVDEDNDDEIDNNDIAEHLLSKSASSTVMTAGHALVNQYLPEGVKEYSKQLDKKSLKSLFQKVADKFPEQYANVVNNLSALGDNEGLYAIDQLHYNQFKPTINLTPYLEEARKNEAKYIKEGLSKNDAKTKAYAEVKLKLNTDTIEKGVKEKNAIAIMGHSGARGSPAQITDTIASPILVSDYKNRAIGIEIDKSYSQGLTPAQYFAQSYGTRRGYISVKMAVPLSGYLSKMLGWSMNNLVVTEDDCGTQNGVSYPIEDSNNIGKYLAKSYGSIKRNTLITPEVLSSIKDKTILVRSVMTCESDTGICKLCLGKTERGGLAEIGYNAGINSSAAMSEPLSQGMLSEKHTGGAIKKKIGGYPLIKSLFEIPEKFPNKAQLSEEFGKIKSIEKKPWGGYTIIINEKKYDSPEENKPIVKVNDQVEPGTQLTEGMIHPAEFTKLRGAGEGRKNLSNSLKEAFAEMGFVPDRTIFELAGKAFVNYAIADDVVKDRLPGELSSLNSMIKDIKLDSKIVKVKDVKPGNYLAKNILHYTVGTIITPSIKKDILDNDISEIHVTEEKPPFTSVMVRIQDTASIDPDWVTRLYSQGLKKNIIDAVQKGLKSKHEGINFVHPYIRGTTFGKNKLY